MAMPPCICIVFGLSTLSIRTKNTTMSMQMDTGVTMAMISSPVSSSSGGAPGLLLGTIMGGPMAPYAPPCRLSSPPERTQPGQSVEGVPQVSTCV